MRNLFYRNNKIAYQASGFSLLEVIIATIIIAIGLLGFAKLQQQSLRSIQDTNNANAAAYLAMEMANRLTSNQLEIAKRENSAYIKSFSSINAALTAFETRSGENSQDTAFLNSILPNTNNCYSEAGCSNTERAVADLFSWKTELQQLIPGAQSRICFDSDPSAHTNSLACDDNVVLQGNSVAYTIKIMWDNIKGDKELYYTQVLAYTGSQTATTNELSPIGIVVNTTGATNSQHATDQPRTLKKNDDIYVADLISTDANSSVQVKLYDNSMIYLQSDTKFKIDQFKFDLAKPAENVNIMTLITGGFRTLTGFIADQTPDNYKVNTDVATMGVRGTYWGAVYLSGQESAPLSITVWQDPRLGAKQSHVVVQNGVSTMELGADQPYQNATVYSKDEPIEPEEYPSPAFEPVTWVHSESTAINAVEDITKEQMDPTASLEEYLEGWSHNYLQKILAFFNLDHDINADAELNKRRGWFLHRQYMEQYKEVLKYRNTNQYEHHLQQYLSYYKQYHDEMIRQGKNPKPYDTVLDEINKRMLSPNSGQPHGNNTNSGQPHGNN